ncbi:hypothetical protein [Lentibacillus amyloliquefaciens]|uniref:Peptidyl-prolyl cis-trans isomerase n=1 Tax=Lentibacillus amyloliquefaciens TaxID=1472767 RepID=A0A0U4EVG8_9BACI|nr:hypothetical protein [Lentibacillus amyloliquefaciens]ALX47351.1 hypothetical protein AOX59_01285 [Lentibacillus amyloliquefaciens]
MILPITGKVAYAITLDPTVWIFDKRKILLEEAFNAKSQKVDEEDEVKKASERWDRAVNTEKQKQSVNKNITKAEGKKFLENSYVMPIKEFLTNTSVKEDAQNAILETANGEETIPLKTLENSLLLFALDGKPLKEDGPVHLFYNDGSNRDNPIKSIKKIIID